MVYYRVDFRGTLHGIESFQHGHHVDSPGLASDVADDAAAQWLALLANGAFSGTFSTGIVWADVNVSELGATPSAPVVTSAQAAIGDNGTSATTSLPPQCSVVCSLRTATAGSRARGRMFLPPVITTDVTASGRLESTPQNDLADNLEDYFTAMATAGHSPCVLSGQSGAYVEYPLTSIRIGNVIDTQQRRRSNIAEVYQVRSL